MFTLIVLDRDNALSAVPRPATARSAAPPALSGKFSARVVRVSDGDTLTVRTHHHRQIKVRLARIDAPETSHGTRRPGQPFGETATRSLRQLVGDGSIVLDCPETDRYQRHVCWVLAGAVNVNLEQVRRGMAWVYRPPRASKRELQALSPLLDAQETARQAARGLWSEAEPIAPWDWRRACWQAGKCRSSARR